MYILLCGYPPFNGETDKDIMARVKAGRFKFYSEDWSDISGEAKDLITKMLTYSPESRISAEEALHHPWFTTKKKTEYIIDSSLMKKLANFNVHSQSSVPSLIFLVLNKGRAKTKCDKPF